jgi:hypothetical protein
MGTIIDGANPNAQPGGYGGRHVPQFEQLGDLQA